VIKHFRIAMAAPYGHWRVEETHVRDANADWAARVIRHSVHCDNVLVQRIHAQTVGMPSASSNTTTLIFDSFAARGERKRLTRNELEGNDSALMEVDVVPRTRLCDAGIFVQQHLDNLQLQFWCCAHMECGRVLTVGRDGCVNEQLLRAAEMHVHAIHGDNARARDDRQDA
jgi:hypothetical protein